MKRSLKIGPSGVYSECTSYDYGIYLFVQETALEKCQQENTSLQTTVKSKEEEVLNVYFN